MPNLFQPNKFASGTLVGCGGNIFSVLGYFRGCAKSSGWSNQDIEIVRNAVALSKSYDDALGIVDAHLQCNENDRIDGNDDYSDE